MYTPQIFIAFITWTSKLISWWFVIFFFLILSCVLFFFLGLTLLVIVVVSLLVSLSLQLLGLGCFRPSVWLALHTNHSFRLDRKVVTWAFYLFFFYSVSGLQELIVSHELVGCNIVRLLSYIGGGAWVVGYGALDITVCSYSCGRKEKTMLGNVLLGLGFWFLFFRLD